jgi:hypothetical protein
MPQGFNTKSLVAAHSAAAGSSLHLRAPPVSLLFSVSWGRDPPAEDWLLLALVSNPCFAPMGSSVPGEGLIVGILSQHNFFSCFSPFRFSKPSIRVLRRVALPTQFNPSVGFVVPDAQDRHSLASLRFLKFD